MPNDLPLPTDEWPVHSTHPSWPTSDRDLPEWRIVLDDSQPVAARARALGILARCQAPNLVPRLLPYLERSDLAEPWQGCVLAAVEGSDVLPDDLERLVNATLATATQRQQNLTPYTLQSFACTMRILGIRLPKDRSRELLPFLAARPNTNETMELKRRQCVLQAIQTIYSATPPAPTELVTELQDAVYRLCHQQIALAAYQGGPASSLTTNAVVALACLDDSRLPEIMAFIQTQAPTWLQTVVSKRLTEVEQTWPVATRGRLTQALASLRHTPA